MTYWRALLGDRAYKLKKPVKLDFLDFSTREARERILHREVELSDETRKDITGIGHGTAVRAPWGEGIYDAATSQATYRVLLDRARRALELGEPVVLDASWSRVESRTAAARLAQATTSDFVELRCDAPETVVAGRITRRLADGVDVSDAFSGNGWNCSR
jgi:predicted kinase